MKLMPAKIVFVGSHGTGKTSLMESVNRFIRFPVLNSAARQIMSEMHIRSIADMRNQNIENVFQEKVSKRTIGSHASAKCMISDRSIYDRWGYDSHLFLTNLDYEKMISRANLKYDMIIRVPIEFIPEHDGVRSTDEVERFAIQEEIFRLVEESGMPFMNVTGSLSERTAQVLCVLSAAFDGMEKRINQVAKAA